MMGSYELSLEDVFKKVQKIISSIPLILIGTGGSIPYGIPGMPGLAKELQIKITPLFETDDSWKEILNRLKNGDDLEKALTHLYPEPSEKLLASITKTTWEFINSSDLNFFQKLLTSRVWMPLTTLFVKLTQTSQKNINIITTNYDRIIEYACDSAKLEVDDRFRGLYKKWGTSSSAQKRNVINLLKVHGSLDYFKDQYDNVISVPQSSAIPEGFIPDIIPPGSEKYRSVLQGIHRTLLLEADQFIQSATGFLCIGYGFNDEQIQTKMIEAIKAGIPLIVLTKNVSTEVVHMLQTNSTNYVIINEAVDVSGGTEFIVNGQYLTIEENYWSVEGFLKMI